VDALLARFVSAFKRGIEGELEALHAASAAFEIRTTKAEDPPAHRETLPVARASEAVMTVQDDMYRTENRINTSRMDYTDAVNAYNTLRNSFPAVLTASLLGFKEQPYFEAEPGARTAPSVGDANSLRKPATQPAPAAPAAPPAPANTAPVKP